MSRARVLVGVVVGAGIGSMLYHQQKASTKAVKTLMTEQKAFSAKLKRPDSLAKSNLPSRKLFREKNITK